MLDAVIVGGGLFGQVAAAALRRQGRNVVVLDSKEPLAGSGPAACLMKPSWFSSMGRDVYEPSLQLLDDLYGVKDLNFALIPTRANARVHWCDPQSILKAPTIQCTADSIKKTDRGWLVLTTSPDNCLQTFAAPLVVVATGIWTERLLPQYKQQGQMGAAFLYTTGSPILQQPFIRPWAPYKQLVAFDRGDGLWVGDGTAIKQENWTEERQMTSMARCQDAVRHSVHGWPDKVLTGIRPYAKGHKPCLLEQASPGLWVASGGAKNGTLAAGYCAHVISRATS